MLMTLDAAQAPAPAEPQACHHLSEHCIWLDVSNEDVKKSGHVRVAGWCRRCGSLGREGKWEKPEDRT